MSNSNMDPFDEFEFKPLTDGLGFHKKSVTLKEGLKNTGVLEDELQTIPAAVPAGLIEEEPQAGSSKRTSFEDVLSALEKNPLPRKGIPELEFTEPLPREAKREPVQSPFPRPDAYRVPVPGTPAAPLAPTAEKPSTGTRRGAADSPPRSLVPATISIPSALLDFVIVSAVSIVFLVALLTVTKVDLNAVIRNLGRDPMTQIALGIMFIAVMQMYVVIARSFFGATVGEWTFDLQVGRDDEQGLESYPLKVAFRSLIVTCTGLIFLPLISAMIGRDIAGGLSGVKLFRQSV